MKNTDTLSIMSAIVNLVLIALLVFGLAKGFASPGLSVMIIAGIAPRRIASLFQGMLAKVSIETLGVAALSAGAMLWLHEILSAPEVSPLSLASLIILWLLGLAVAVCRFYAVALADKA